MHGNTFNTQPLDWSIYKALMRRMDEFIADNTDYKKVKYAKYQTSIALGCNLGLTFGELIRFRWIDVVGVDRYIFKDEPHRLPIIINEEVTAIALRNYAIVNPMNSEHYIVNSSLSANNKLIAPHQYNAALKAIFEYFGIVVPTPCSQTLRRTYARKIWIDQDKSEEALHEISEILQCKLSKSRRYVTI